MRIPNGGRAVADVAKLREYCLSPHHLRGRHKARVFAALLGLTADEAEELRDALLHAAASQDASVSEQDQYGQRYVVDFIMTPSFAQARVRSCWIVRSGEDFPRLTSCYVLR